MKSRKQAYISLHIAVFLFGFTAILGRLIQLSEMEIVWYRVLLTSLSLLFIPGLLREVRAMKRKEIAHLAGIGLLVVSHWVCFYGSIKYSNVTVALSVLSTTAFFTALLEPLFFSSRVKKQELFLGALIIPGMYLIFHFGKLYLTGILLSLMAAILASIFTILNRKKVKQHSPMAMTFVELSAGWVFLSLLVPAYRFFFPEVHFAPSPSDFAWLLVLALLCTTLAYSLALGSLRRVSAFTFNISINLEPVYGIVMAVVLFRENEYINPAFYLGTAIILAAIFIHVFMEYRAGRKAVKKN